VPVPRVAQAARIYVTPSVTVPAGLIVTLRHWAVGVVEGVTAVSPTFNVWSALYKAQEKVLPVLLVVP